MKKKILLKALEVQPDCWWIKEGKIYEGTLRDLNNGYGPFAVIKDDNGNNTIVDYTEETKQLEVYVKWEIIEGDHNG